MKLPGFMFYPGDWVKDPDLCRCSKAAKGMWIDMICKAFELKERGIFISAQIPWTREEIAGAVGGDVAENLILIEELISKGVARIDKRNAIYSERLVKDERIRQIRSEAGELGGRPTKYQKQQGVVEKSKLKANHKAKTKLIHEYENENELVVKTVEAKKKASYEGIRAYCLEIQLTEDDADWVFDKWQGNGWKNDGRPILDWKATVRSWKRIFLFPSQRDGNGKARVKQAPGKSIDELAKEFGKSAG